MGGPGGQGCWGLGDVWGWASLGAAWGWGELETGPLGSVWGWELWGAGGVRAMGHWGGTEHGKVTLGPRCVPGCCRASHGGHMAWGEQGVVLVPARVPRRVLARVPTRVPARVPPQGGCPARPGSATTPASTTAAAATGTTWPSCPPAPSTTGTSSPARCPWCGAVAWGHPGSQGGHLGEPCSWVEVTCGAVSPGRGPRGLCRWVEVT